MQRSSVRSIVFCCVTFLFALGAAAAAYGQAPAAAGGKTAEQVYKNIQVLRGVPADEVIQAMHLIRAALGVDCGFCHAEPDLAADTKPTKQIARKMILMMNAINQGNFGSRQTVTCYTCHRGSPEPSNIPSLPTPEAEAESPKTTLPSADQILDKYVDALGGEQAIRKISSRIIIGTQFIPTGPGGAVPVPAELERDEKAPNLVVNFYRTPTYTVADGFDGTTAWAQDARGRVSNAVKIDQMRAQRDADFYSPLDIRQQFAKLEVTGTEKVDGHDAYVVVATPADDTPERLYFDIQTGLLLRKWAYLPTPAGRSPSEVDFSDYRDTGSGVKFPFLITMTPASTRSVLFTVAQLRVTKVQDNATIDDSKFVKPQSKGSPQ